MKTDTKKTNQYPVNSDSFLKYYDAQALYTDALANKYPKVPIKDILGKLSTKKFSNTKLDQLTDSLVSKHGDIYLDKNEVSGLMKKGYPDVFQYDRDIKTLDSTNANTSINTTGKKETSPDRFGWRMATQKSYPEGATPYKFLDNKKQFAEGGGLPIENMNPAPMLQSIAGLGTDIIDQTKFGKTRGGSALSGAVKGSASLASFGPAGMAAGAVLGGVGGLLKAGAEKRAESAEQLTHQYRVNSLLASNLPGQPSYTPTFKDGGFVSLELLGFKANGGKIKNTVSDLDNTTYYPTGESHQNNIHGGIPIGNALVEQDEFRYDSKTKGSYIFSSRF